MRIRQFVHGVGDIGGEMFSVRVMLVQGGESWWDDGWRWCCFNGHGMVGSIACEWPVLGWLVAGLGLEVT